MPTRYASPNSDSSNACDIGGKKSATRSACPLRLASSPWAGFLLLAASQSGIATRRPVCAGLHL